jgi:hypothetical protein
MEITDEQYRQIEPMPRPIHRLMDRAYAGDETRQLALD